MFYVFVPSKYVCHVYLLEFGLICVILYKSAGGGELSVKLLMFLFMGASCSDKFPFMP